MRYDDLQASRQRPPRYLTSEIWHTGWNPALQAGGPVMGFQSTLANGGEDSCLRLARNCETISAKPDEYAVWQHCL
jgi:hypothetical protein